MAGGVLLVVVALLLLAWALGWAAFGALGVWACSRPLGHLDDGRSPEA